LINVLVKVEMK